MELEVEKGRWEGGTSNPLIRLVIALVSLGVLYSFYKFVLIPEENFLRSYTEILARLSAIPIRWFGYTVDFMRFGNSTSTWLYLNKLPNVEVGYACNGFNIILVFGTFLFMFRGNLKKKIIFFVLGYILINIVNVLRISALAVNYLKDPVSMEFNHKYTYTIIIYAIIGGLWFLWLNKFANETTKEIPVS